MVTPMMSISDRVTEALENDPRTKDVMLDVAGERGIITLTGTVKTDAERQAAEEIARQQSGVITVINEIKVG